MAGFDRSKLKATSIATIKKQEQEHELKRPSNNFDKNYLTIKDGAQKFRIFPFHHDGGGTSYAEPKCVSFLSVTTSERDENGKETGKTTIKRRPIFNSKVHGNLPYDLVEEYLNFAKKTAIPNYTEDGAEQKKIWNKLTGMEGVKPQDTWEVYAVKEEGQDKDGHSVWSKPGELSLKKSIKDQMVELAASFSSDVQSPDPFSDPDEGIPIIITKSGKGLDTEYKVELDSVTVREKGRATTEYNIVPLGDDQLEAWSKMTPLYKMYANAFKKSDFAYQVEGLKRFDDELAEKHGYSVLVFQYDEFLDIVEQISELVPDEKEEGGEAEDTQHNDVREELEEDQRQSEEEEEVKQPIVARRGRTSLKDQQLKENKPAASPVTSNANKATRSLDDIRKRIGARK